MRQVLSIIILCLCFNTAQATKNVKCEPVKVDAQGKNIILPGVDSKQSVQIYFLKNTSKQSLWLDHPNQHRSASAGWSSYLQPDKWSALLLNRKNFTISCAVINPGKLEYQNCAKSLSLCTPANFIFNSKRNGSYWLAEDKSWDDLIIALESRGVKFK